MDLTSFLIVGGADGTRTRDLWRDLHVGGVEEGRDMAIKQGGPLKIRTPVVLANCPGAIDRGSRSPQTPFFWLS